MKKLIQFIKKQIRLSDEDVERKRLIEFEDALVNRLSEYTDEKALEIIDRVCFRILS